MSRLSPKVQKFLDMLECDGHYAHCYHVFRGSIAIVLRDGFIAEKCCKCGAKRTIHAEHRSGSAWG